MTDASCGECGMPLELVRPGKYQCNHCELVEFLEERAKELEGALSDVILGRKSAGDAVRALRYLVQCPDCGSRDVHLCSIRGHLVPDGRKSATSELNELETALVLAVESQRWGTVSKLRAQIAQIHTRRTDNLEAADYGK